jgi:GNAT superfamily N-acetyltransferase
MAMKYLQSLTLKEVTERWDKEEDRGAYKGKQFVAEVNGEVVGWCEVRLAKFGIGFEQLSQYAVDRNASLAEVPLMTNLCVDKDFRGQGVGKGKAERGTKRRLGGRLERSDS